MPRLHTSVFCIILICTGLLGAPAHADKRVVSIGGDLTEIVYALGQGDMLVATDSTSVFPAAAQDTPKVGYVRQLSAEGVLSVEPDLLLLSGAAGPPGALEQLRVSGVEMIELPASYSMDAILEKIDVVAAALNVEEIGKSLRTDVEQSWNDAQSAVEGLPDDLSVLFFSTLRDGAPRAAGRETAAHGLIEMLGARNVFGERTGYKGLSLEAAVAADPDVILVMDRYVEMAGGLETVKAHPAIALTTAAKNDLIILVDAVQAMQFSPRTPSAVARLATAIETSLARVEGKAGQTAEVAN
ncbi:MAG: ABC transporter substrate-binding protein [Pseudomonadota bacterium]